MNMALAPLQLQGVCILNYLDDWKIVAQSLEFAISHRDMVLDRLRSSGLSMLLPGQQIIILGVDPNSRAMRAHLPPTRLQSFQDCLVSSDQGDWST